MAKKRIIFVDDEPNVIDGLRRMLRRQRDEWDTVFVTSATEALQRMAQEPFDVIVTDMQMPGMDGAELLECVLREHPDVARIVLSGHAGDASIRALQVAHQYLSKPTDPDALRLAIARACPLDRIVRNERIRTAVATLETLPSMPTLCAEITRAVESETGDARQIGRIISRDIAMSAKVLQLVNSSFFGIGRRVSSVDQAVALLGGIRIKALVLADHVFKAFALPRTFRQFSMETLWRHSLAVGEVAALIARTEKQGGDRPDQAFTAGLLHDIGILVLACRRSDDFARVLDLVLKGDQLIGDAEMEVLEVTHAEIGAYLLGLWGLPARLVEAVALHHQANETPYDGLCALTAVHVADVLAGEALATESNEGGRLLAPELDLPYLERIGLAGRLDRWRELAVKTCAEAVESQT